MSLIQGFPNPLHLSDTHFLISLLEAFINHPTSHDGCNSSIFLEIQLLKPGLLEHREKVLSLFFYFEKKQFIVN